MVTKGALETQNPSGLRNSPNNTVLSTANQIWLRCLRCPWHLQLRSPCLQCRFQWCLFGRGETSGWAWEVQHFSGFMGGRAPGSTWKRFREVNARHSVLSPIPRPVECRWVGLKIFTSLNKLLRKIMAKYGKVGPVCEDQGKGSNLWLAFQIPRLSFQFLQGV